MATVENSSKAPEPLKIDVESSSVKKLAPGLITGFTKSFVMHGNNDVQVFINDVNAQNAVVGSLTELDGNNQPFLGLASMDVHNMCPFNGGFYARLSVGWPSNLRVRLNFISS